jgi:hypothetical protein
MCTIAPTSQDFRTCQKEKQPNLGAALSPKILICFPEENKSVSSRFGATASRIPAKDPGKLAHARKGNEAVGDLRSRGKYLLGGGPLRRSRLTLRRHPRHRRPQVNVPSKP